MEKTSELLIYLMACSLQEIKPEETLLANIDMEALLRLAKAHSVSAMVCMALEQTDAFRCAEESIRLKWLDSKNKAIRKNMLLDAERHRLEKEFAEHGIWYMPLKGSILKDWYPKFGMREMADNDILFDATRRQQVRDIFVNRGYSIESYNKSNHDAYEKQPIYNFEMHVALFHEDRSTPQIHRSFCPQCQTERQCAPFCFSAHQKKYENVVDRLVQDEKLPFRYHFTPEDFYVFVVAHAYKHYSHGGTGIRTLADFYVMNRKLGKTLDWEYVESELRSLGILDYERDSRKLSQKLFGNTKTVLRSELTEEENQMFAYYLGATTYGNLFNQTLHRMQEFQPDGEPLTTKTKGKYIISRMFPNMEWCKCYAPVVYKFPVLLPFYWVWRLIYKGITKRKKVTQEIKALKAVSRR